MLNWTFPAGPALRSRLGQDPFPRPAKRRPKLLLAFLAAACLAPLTAAQDGQAVAIVNGQPISRDELVTALIDSYGLQVLQQLIVLELARQETRRLNITVSPADIQHEYEQALLRIVPDADTGGEKISAADRQRSFEKLLEQKGLSMREFMLGMERNAHLRKIIERDLKVTEATLREEFARVHGERVEVRVIQVADPGALTEALGLLEKQTPFAEVAQRFSKDPNSAANGGRIEPFTFTNNDIAPVLREAAFSMTPGEVSKPIRVGTWWFLLKLEKRIPPAGVRFEDVRPQIEQSLRSRVVPQEMNKRVTELFQRAKVRVLDDGLRVKYEKLMKENALAPPAGP